MISDKSKLMDDLSDFDEFRQDILPAIRRDLKSGMSSEDLRKKYLSWVTARQLTIALSDKDSGRANMAAKDVQDRAEGRATEKKEVTHKFEHLPDAELDALLLSKMGDKDEADAKLKN